MGSRPGFSFRQEKWSHYSQGASAFWLMLFCFLFCFVLFFIFLVGAFVFCFLRIPVYPTLGNPGEQGEPRELKCVHNNW